MDVHTHTHMHARAHTHTHTHTLTQNHLIILDNYAHYVLLSVVLLFICWGNYIELKVLKYHAKTYYLVL